MAYSGIKTLLITEGAFPYPKEIAEKRKHVVENPIPRPYSDLINSRIWCIIGLKKEFNTGNRPCNTHF